MTQVSRKLLVAFFLLLGTLGAQAENRRLVILHTNDIHGYIEAYPQGGLENIAYLIEQYRALYPGEVVLLDAGDTSLGTPLSGFFHGQPTAEMMAYLRYDAVALGNHEFNWGKEKMRAVTDAIQAPVLCANLVATDGSAAPYPPFTILERNGTTLAIVGLVAPDTSRRAPAQATEGWEFLPPHQALQGALATLPDVDALISLNHLGLEGDRKLARAVPVIDLIVGGDSHSVLREPVYEDGTPIVQAGCYGQYLGVLKVEIDTEKNSLKVLQYDLVPANLAIQADERAHQIVERYEQKLGPLLEKEVATVSALVSKEPHSASFDTPLGNLVSDVFCQIADTDIALYNRGGVRFDMEPGPLTVETVHKLFPYDDPVVVLQGTGKQIRAVVEQGTIDGEGPLSSSGLQAKIKDGRVDSIEIRGIALQDDRLYSVATTSFLASGGDGMTALTELQNVRSLGYTREVLLQYLEDHPSLRPPDTGRLTIEK